MVLRKCRECGHDVSTEAKTCPNCGAPPVRKTSTLAIVILVLLIVFVGLPLLGHICSSIKQKQKRSSRLPGDINGNVKQESINTETLLKDAMSYLSGISEIEWYEIYKNNVYIGFKTLPSDWRIIINGAALRGNETIDSGVHVWAINANKFSKGWRPGDGSYYGEVTARYGKIR